MSCSGKKKCPINNPGCDPKTREYTKKRSYGNKGEEEDDKDFGSEEQERENPEYQVLLSEDIP